MPSDWHKEDIKAAVRKRGITLRELSLRAGFCDAATRQALKKSWPDAEKAIADFLGVTPQTIWPSRYDANGVPRRGLHSKVDPKADRRRRHRQK